MIFTQPHVILNLYDFLQWNTKYDILINIVNQTVSIPIVLHYFLKNI